MRLRGLRLKRQQETSERGARAYRVRVRVDIERVRVKAIAGNERARSASV